MDELARIEILRARLARDHPDVQLGIGDDAAVLAPGTGPQVLSVDVVVEDVHFVRGWLSLYALGRRAMVAAVSDLAAMGALGRVALSSLVLPAWLDDDDLGELADGIGAGSDECKIPVVGGNLSAGAKLSITTTVIGEVGEVVLTRAGARPGDGIYVTGRVGAAGLGLAFLKAGRKDEGVAMPFVDRWCWPNARLEIGQQLLEHASACIDVSDGVLRDLGHLCQASAVGARVHASKLPVLRGFADGCEAVGRDPFEVALGSGEDYELLFTSASTIPTQVATRIGEVTGEAGCIDVFDAAGRELDVTATGFSHF